MAIEVVGISEMIITDKTTHTLITYSLGSCIAVSAYDPISKKGGLIHCMLPYSKLDIQKAEKIPCMFVDTGLSLFYERLLEIGVNKEKLCIRSAGGASLMKDDGKFRIGQHNFESFVKFIKSQGLLVDRYDVGGSVSRTLSLEIATGKTMMKISGISEIEL